MMLDQKPRREVRQALPDTKEAAADDGVVVKHTTLLKKREPVRSEVHQ